MSYEQQQFINECGFFVGKLAKAFARGQQNKSKPACYLEFNVGERVVSCRLSNPLQARDYYKIASFLATQGKAVTIDQLMTVGQERTIERLNGMAGATCLLCVTPFEYNGKTYFSATDFFKEKFAPKGAKYADQVITEDDINW